MAAFRSFVVVGTQIKFTNFGGLPAGGASLEHCTAHGMRGCWCENMFITGQDLTNVRETLFYYNYNMGILTIQLQNFTSQPAISHNI